jgi:tRNA modification GTPase
MDLPDTIIALATGHGKAAIAIIRVSGPQCESILKRLCKRDFWRRRHANYTPIFDLNGALLDRAIVLVFEGPQSFTGENMIEFQITGGLGVKSTLLRSLLKIPGTRAAQPGEFARRAFKNGKLDLVQVEGLAAIVDAESEADIQH